MKRFILPLTAAILLAAGAIPSNAAETNAPQHRATATAPAAAPIVRTFEVTASPTHPVWNDLGKSLSAMVTGPVQLLPATGNVVVTANNDAEMAHATQFVKTMNEYLSRRFRVRLTVFNGDTPERVLQADSHPDEPVTYTATREVAYIPQVSVTSSGNQTTTSLSPSTIILGVFSQFRVRPLDDKTIHVSYDFKHVDLKSMEQFESNGTTVQLPQTDTMTTTNEVVLRSGEAYRGKFSGDGSADKYSYTLTVDEL